MISWIIRLENLLIFLIAVLAFYLFEGSWWWFLAWILPDLGMVGYLWNPRVGARIYNLTHTYIFALAIFILGILVDQDSLIAVGIVFISHVSLDRGLGFGLKYPTHFKDTHIQRLD